MNSKSSRRRNRGHPGAPALGTVVAAVTVAIAVVLAFLIGSALVGSSTACVDAKCLPNGQPVNCGKQPPELCETKMYEECIATASWRVQDEEDTKSCHGSPQPCANKQKYHCCVEDCRWNVTCQTYVVSWYGFGGWCKNL